MKKQNAHDLVLAGLLGAIGIILPFLTAHGFGVPGTILLPMHLPVLLTGFLCGPLFGAVGGLVVPLISSLTTGMPPLFPMLPIMAGELTTYGFVSGLLYRQKKLSLYPSLLTAMLCGRLVYGLIFSALLTANNGALRALSVSAAFVQGLPGIAIQLALVPMIVSFIQHHGSAAPQSGEEQAIAEACRMIAAETASFIVIRNGKIVHSAEGRGVKPVMQVLDGNPDILKGATVVDKIIGKAAALLLVLGGVNRVHGVVMSASGFEYLQKTGISVSYTTKIDVVSDRTGTGICPLELSVQNVESPQMAYAKLKETIRKLMSKAV